MSATSQPCPCKAFQILAYNYLTSALSNTYNFDCTSTGLSATGATMFNRSISVPVGYYSIVINMTNTRTHWIVFFVIV